MATFEINEDSELSAEEVIELQAIFEKLEPKIKEVGELGAAAREYFRELAVLGEQLAVLSKFSENINVDGNEYYESEYGDAVTASNLFGFWLPSSMRC